MLRQISLPRCSASLSSLLISRSYSTSPIKPPLPRKTTSSPPISKRGKDFKSSPSKPSTSPPTTNYSDKAQRSQSKSFTSKSQRNTPTQPSSKNIQIGYKSSTHKQQKSHTQTTEAKKQSQPTRIQTQLSKPTTSSTIPPQEIQQEEAREITDQTKKLANTFLQNGDIAGLNNSILTMEPRQCLSLFGLVKDKLGSMAGQTVSQFYLNLFERILTDSNSTEDIIHITNETHEGGNNLFSDMDYKYVLCKVLQQKQFELGSVFFDLMERAGVDYDIETHALMDRINNYVLADEREDPKQEALFNEIIAKGDNFVLREQDFETLIEYWEKMEIYVHVVPIIDAMRDRGFEPSVELRERLKHLFADVPEEYARLFPAKQIAKREKGK